MFVVVLMVYSYFFKIWLNFYHMFRGLCFVFWEAGDMILTGITAAELLLQRMRTEYARIGKVGVGTTGDRCVSLPENVRHQRAVYIYVFCARHSEHDKTRPPPVERLSEKNKPPKIYLCSTQCRRELTHATSRSAYSRQNAWVGLYYCQIASIPTCALKLVTEKAACSITILRFWGTAGTINPFTRCNLSFLSGNSMIFAREKVEEANITPTHPCKT